MTFEDAIRKSIRSFYKGEGLKEYTKDNPFKYTREYFENAEKNLLDGKKGAKDGKRSS